MEDRPALTLQDWGRLNRLLEQALELAEAERPAWLETLPAESADLRPLLVQLLAASEAGDLTDELQPPTTVARAASEALVAMRRERAGDRIGPWQLERLLAEGGMGTVWLARRADGVIERQAALKLPRAEWVDRGLAERIARERAILARLQHPAIAVLYDAGLTAEGRPYLALEYVDGQPFDAWCRERASDLRQLLRLFVQVVRAVAYAHSRLVIHRDLKPANVLITAEGRPKLLDFGISKLIQGDAPAADATALTRLAGRPLTPAYAAPEQVLGQPVTVASDVYALGVMLFELASSARLYTATTAHALEAEILRGNLRRPSDAATDKARGKALRGDLDAIVLTALKRDPEGRYQSAAELADDIERYLDSKPVRAQADSAAYRLRKFVARNRVPVVAGGAVLAALAVGLGIALWQAGQARHQAEEAQRQAEEARNQTERATALNTFVLSLIRQFDPNASQSSKAADLALLASIEQRIDAEFKGSADQLLQLRVTVGEAYRNRGEMMAARRVFVKAVEEASPHLPPDDLQLLRARVQAADFNLVISMAAARDLDVAIGLLRTKGADGAGTLIDALLIKRTLGGRFQVPEPLSLQQMDAIYEEAYQLATRHFGAGSRERLKVVEQLAFHLSFLKNPHTRPVDLLRSELEAAQTRPDVIDSPEFLAAKASHGRFLHRDGQHAEGMRQMQSAVDTIRSSHGPNSLQLEVPLNWIYESLRDLDDPIAIGFLLESLRVAAARERPPSTNLLRRSEYVFYVALVEDCFDMAEDAYQQAIANLPAVPEEALRDKFALRLIPGRVALLALTGRTREAEALGTSSESALATFYGYRQLSGLSLAQRQNGRYAAAIETTRRYEQMCLETKRARGFDGCMAAAHRLRATAQLDAGDPAAALLSANQSLEFRKEYDADQGLAIGRVRLANGLAKEALEPLRRAYGYWLGWNPRSHWAAEAEYWLGRAWIANGEEQRGRRMVAEARKALAMSPMPSHRALAASADAR